MGGASENDDAMAWFPERAGDGDGVVGISDILGVLSRFGDNC